MTSFRRRTTLFALLVICFAVQAFAMKRTGVFPDLVLLVVVFTGIFFGSREAVAFGLIAGFMRGAFSVDTMGVDILVFPLVGALSSMLGGMVYHQNPAAQMLAVSASIVVVIAAHTGYLNMISGNNASLLHVFYASWKTIALTVAVSPFFFFLSKRSLKL
mgnify:CR=1 FL=1